VLGRHYGQAIADTTEVQGVARKEQLPQGIEGEGVCSIWAGCGREQSTGKEQTDGDRDNGILQSEGVWEQ
jgi:hypothetical protein